MKFENKIKIDRTQINNETRFSRRQYQSNGEPTTAVR